MSPRGSLRTVWKIFRQGNGLLWATGLTYATLFAIVPLFAVALSLFKALGNFDALVQRVLPIISEMIDPSQKIQIMQHIEGYVETIHAGALGTVGTLVFFLTSIPLYMNAERAVNTLWGKSENRTIWLRFAACWLLITLGPFAIVTVLSSLSLLNRYLAQLPLGHPLAAVRVAFIILVFFLIYKVVPNTDVRNKPAAIGALTGGLAWIAAYHLYQAYMTYAASSFNIYGSLGAIPVFLLWIYINWIILLLGVIITKLVQYPMLAGSAGAFTATDHVLAAVEMLQMLFTRILEGKYYTEERILSDVHYPPEVTATVVQRLLGASLIAFKGDIILPVRAAQDISIAALVEIFIGRMETDIYQRLGLEPPPLTDIHLTDLK